MPSRHATLPRRGRKPPWMPIHSRGHERASWGFLASVPLFEHIPRAFAYELKPRRDHANPVTVITTEAGCDGFGIVAGPFERIAADATAPPHRDRRSSLLHSFPLSASAIACSARTNLRASKSPWCFLISHTNCFNAPNIIGAADIKRALATCSAKVSLSAFACNVYHQPSLASSPLQAPGSLLTFHGPGVCAMCQPSYLRNSCLQCLFLAFIPCDGRGAFYWTRPPPHR